MLTRTSLLLALALAGSLACANWGQTPSVSKRSLTPIVPDRLVVLTFDDAVRSHYTTVAPLLERYGFGATFFVTEFPQPPFSDTTLYMTWAQIGDLHRRGFESRTTRGSTPTSIEWTPRASPTNCATSRTSSGSLGAPTP
jgi:hypothetical protein